MRKIHILDKRLFMGCGQSYFHRAYWINDDVRESIEEVLLDHPLVRHLTPLHKEKLLLVLIAIPYAEHKIVENGKWLTKICKNFISVVPSLSRFTYTLGHWNLHSMHARKFDYGEREFRKILLDNRLGLDYVVSYIIQFIGLEKPFAHIMAEYNHKEHATIIAGLQKALKQHFDGRDLAQDGLIGAETKKALKIKAIELNYDGSQLHVHSAIKLRDFFEKNLRITLCPKIPNLKRKRDLKHLWRLLKKRERQNYIYLLFANHINVPAYVKYSIEAARLVGYKNHLFT